MYYLLLLLTGAVTTIHDDLTYVDFFGNSQPDLNQKIAVAPSSYRLSHGQNSYTSCHLDIFDAKRHQFMVVFSAVFNCPDPILRLKLLYYLRSLTDRLLISDETIRDSQHQRMTELETTDLLNYAFQLTCELLQCSTLSMSDRRRLEKHFSRLYSGSDIHAWRGSLPIFTASTPDLFQLLLSLSREMEKLSDITDIYARLSRNELDSQMPTLVGNLSTLPLPVHKFLPYGVFERHHMQR